MKWLGRCFGIPKKRLRAALHLYENMNIPKEILFWKNALGLEGNQFYKPQIRKLKKRVLATGNRSVTVLAV